MFIDSEDNFSSPYLYVCETCRDSGTYTVTGITAQSAQIAPCDGCKRMDGETVTRVTKAA